ncbi:MAG TPA: lytic transglycosylase domain-containing protein [Terriglobales bacterium]|nr:lytic transglycosylase domain-containing protein [Terriglobales bacterium]
MASSVIATVLSLTTTTPYVQAQTGSSAITATTDDNGRKVYVNDGVPAASVGHAQAPVARRSSLVYWSSTAHRWKPVPSSNIRAARSAAAEVNQYLDRGAGSSAPVDFSRGQAFTQEQIDAAIDQAAARHNVDPSLVRAVIKVESNFNPNAVSRRGAMGLMQLMPQTARQLKVSNPFDPEQNVDAGVRHLKKLMESYGGDLRLSLAAYNAGVGAVARSAGVPRIAETRNYVKRITQLYLGESDPDSHLLGGPVHDPVRVQRDARGVLYISNTD